MSLKNLLNSGFFIFDDNFVKENHTKFVPIKEVC
jgi:hypothetical protein